MTGLGGNGYERDRLREPSEDELALWAEIMRGVRPLSRRVAKRRLGAATIDPAPPAAEDAPAEPPCAVKPRARGPAPAVRPPAPPRPETLAERGLTGLDGKRAERLRRGDIAVEARLDLHGLTQEPAHRALDAFLAAAIAADLRCVLVITGKGGARPEPEAAGGRFVMGGESGILRNMLPRWVEQGPHRGRVVALQPAHRKHGGGGAFYLYLRRAR